MKTVAKSSPSLSVMVVNFNGEPFLTECLRSILDQTFKDLEIVAVDDGSTDGSPALLRQFQAEHPAHVSLVCLPANGGVARARQNALESARGRFVTTLDSDDYYCDRRKLELEMALAGKGAIAFSDIQLVNAAGIPIAKMSERYPVREGRIFEEILGRSCMIPRDFICERRLILEAGGYDPSLPIYEDWDLKIRLARRAGFRYTAITGTAYRRHGHGLSMTPHGSQENILRTIFQRHLPEVAPEQMDQVSAAFEKYLRDNAPRATTRGRPA